MKLLMRLWYKKTKKSAIVRRIGFRESIEHLISDKRFHSIWIVSSKGD